MIDRRSRARGRLLRSVRVPALLAVLTITVAPAIPASGPPAQERAVRDLGIRWVEVEPGTVTVGTGKAARPVVVDRFLMSATEVTFGQYDAFCEARGRRKPDDNGWGRGTRPVLNVSYDDAVEFCRWLSEQTGWAIRLPTEAEWLHAAQGGRHSRGYTHSGGNDKNEVSWNLDNSGDRTHPVGTKKPNELGLYDMSGNLWEWCADGPEAGSHASVEDSERALRGDSFDNPGARTGYRVSVRVDRDSRHVNIGFRIARSTDSLGPMDPKDR